MGANWIAGNDWRRNSELAERTQSHKAYDACVLTDTEIKLSARLRHTTETNGRPCCVYFARQLDRPLGQVAT